MYRSSGCRVDCPDLLLLLLLTSRSLSWKMGGMTPSAVGPTFRRKFPLHATVDTWGACKVRCYRVPRPALPQLPPALPPSLPHQLLEDLLPSHHLFQPHVPAEAPRDPTDIQARHRRREQGGQPQAMMSQALAGWHVPHLSMDWQLSHLCRWRRPGLKRSPQVKKSPCWQCTSCPHLPQHIPRPPAPREQVPLQRSVRDDDPAAVE